VTIGVRVRVLLRVTFLLALGIGMVLFDAERRRTVDREGAQARVRLAAALGLPDLALSSNARWLRHPSQAEPSAAFSDAPGSFDVDPAGAWIAPPRWILGAGRRLRIEKRERGVR
jgi:hypothetical protein